MKRVGIYSGTFDPVHKGHIIFALESAKKFGLDKVFLMVEPSPRRKQGVRALEHRTKMVDLAIEGNSNLGQIIIDQGRFTPHETTPVLKERFRGAQLYMLMADDMLKHLSAWPNVEELFAGFTFIVGARKRSEKEINEAMRSIKSTKNVNIEWRTITPSGREFSSSKAKQDLKKHKESGALDPKVYDYIKEHSLYFTDGE